MFQFLLNRYLKSAINFNISKIYLDIQSPQIILNWRSSLSFLLAPELPSGGGEEDMHLPATANLLNYFNRLPSGDGQLICLGQLFSKCGSWTSTISISGAHVRNANCWPHPRPTEFETVGWAQKSVFNKPCRRSWYTLKLKTTVLEGWEHHLGDFCNYPINHTWVYKIKQLYMELFKMR